MPPVVAGMSDGKDSDIEYHALAMRDQFGNPVAYTAVDKTTGIAVVVWDSKSTPKAVRETARARLVAVTKVIAAAAKQAKLGAVPEEDDRDKRSAWIESTDETEAAVLALQELP